jgi:flagellar assembly factor FliW
MLIDTTRFGSVEVSEEDLIFFPEGVLGFSELSRFVLLDDPNDEIFAWLQSCESPKVAFPVLEPELFAENFRVELSRHDLDSLGLKSMEGSRSFSLITIPADPTQMTANLKAPVVINVETRTGRQCVLQDNNLAIREPIFSQLHQRVVQNPTHSIKSQALDWGMAVRLPVEESVGSPAADVAPQV